MKDRSGREDGSVVLAFFFEDVPAAGTVHNRCLDL
jgi:hypothetical protein